MPRARFPDPRRTDEEGIVAVGGDLLPETLLEAYRSGIFPWPVEGLPMLWFCPPRRALLSFADLHIPRSLRPVLRSHPWRLTVDHAFSEVMRRCAEQPRPGQDGTWITSDMEIAFAEFHARGHAHSVEVWDGTRLVGGIYGVDAGGAFSGESMFHEVPNASKVALLHLVDHLKRRGAEWLDVQVMTPHMERLGAREVDRDDYLGLLAQALARGAALFQ